MVRNNQWKKGRVTIQPSTWPSALDGPPGPRLLRSMFDPDCGLEVYLGLVEDRDFAMLLRNTRSVRLFSKFGLVSTSRGKVIFVIFRLADEEEDLSMYELYLNPHDEETAMLLQSWAEQTHLKLLVIDSAEREVVTFWEYPNNHPVAGIAKEAGSISSEGSPSDFRLALAEVQRQYSLQDLWNA